MVKNSFIPSAALILALAAAPPSSAQEAGKGGAAPASALRLSRKAPVVYERQLKALLTPAEKVLARRGDFETNGADGVILLDETLIHSEPDGRRVLVYHRMFQALNESGARMTAEDTFSFRTLDQRIHLAEAQSLPPEGSAVEVEDGSVIMESPQHDAADSVYGDRGQMRIIFPAVKPGTVTRMVVVIEEFDERIPGHFSTWESWGAFWPTRHARTVLHLPEDMEARLRETRLGAGVPEPVKSSAAPGWRTWTYDKHRIKPDRAEHGRPPKSQSGPAVFLTTLPDWETFGDWYRALLRERAEVTEEMAALAREWTRAAGTDEEKAAAILGHVARDIRYTGLEFGLGALQPRAPVEVWKSAFGDCKDKSNLAALLLRSLGIEAHLALIQTEHLGRVERRSPDSRHFNHAIVALRTAQGWQFTDPTLRHVTPGMLAPSSSGRDTLIVKPDCIEWARTPVFEGGLVHYHVDAERAEDGSTEGWLECRAGGFYMATDRAYHENMSREEWKRDAQQTLAGLLPGAQIIDLDTDRSAPDVLWRAYFSQPGRASGGDERVPASFPAGEPVMLSMGQDETRETTRFLWPITWRVTSAVRLPAGWTAAETPPPFDLHTEAYEVEARWEPGSGLLRTFYEGRVPRGDLTPAAHQVVWRGAQSLDAWLQRPLWLARSGETPPAPSPEAAITLGKFPLMPTGEGQLALVDRRYPENGNLDLRRAALRKVLEFFPDDPVTVFNTRTRLATADWEQDKHAEAEKALREILAAPSPKITPEILAWGRYLRALVLMDLKQHEEAARTFEGLAGDTTLSAYRRAWAGFQLSRARAELDQKEGALAAARAGLLLEQAESTPPLLARAAMHLLELDRQQELPPLLASLIERGEDLSVPALTALAQLVAGLHEDGKSAQAATLLDILEKLDFINEGFARALAEAGNALRGGAVAAALQKDLQAWLEARPDTPALKPPPDGWPQSREECAKAFEAADNAASSDLGHRLALRLLTAFEPGTDFPRLLWRAAAHLEHHERQSQPSQPSDLMRFLLDLGLRLPRADDHYWEMRYLQGVVLENLVQDKAAAAKHFSTLADENDMPPAYQPSFIVRAAACHEHLREWEKAAGTWSRLERLTQFGSSGDGLLRAAHLRLEQGNVDEALRLLSLAGGSRDFYLRHTGMKETLEAMLQFADEPALVRATWSLEPAWWPDWKKLRDTLGILESDIEPAIHDVAAFGAEISQAVQEKDAARAGELFRQLAHNARWVPAHVINTVWASLYRMEDLHPRHVRELKLFNLSLLESGRVFTEDNRRARSLYSVMCFLDTDQQEAALNHIGEYFNAHPRDDHAISFTMSRLWALAAVEEKNERPACITRLRQDLAAPALRQDRMASVRQLVRLLRLEDMQSEIRPLLEGELSHPAHSQDQEALAALKDMLRSETEGAAVTRTVQRWLERHAPPWFDAVQPLSLADAGLDDEDADLDEAVVHSLASAFGYQGQKCSAASRLITVGRVHERFLARLTAALASWPLGPPADPQFRFGPLISPQALEKAQRYLDLGRSEGKQVYQGRPLAGGHYFAPAVFAGIRPDHRLAREEIFAPILAVLHAPDFASALAWASDSDYALTGGVFSRLPQHLDEAQQRFGVGNLYLNRAITGARVGVQPFGGVALSGTGVQAGGEDYLRQFVWSRVVSSNRLRHGYVPGIGH